MINETLGQFVRGYLEKSAEWDADYLMGQIGANLGPAALLGAPGVSYAKMVTDKARTKADAPLSFYKELLRKANRGKGRGIRSPSGLFSPFVDLEKAAPLYSPKLDDVVLKGRKINPTRDVMGVVKSRKVKLPSLGMLAHEFGHAQQKSLKTPVGTALYGAGMYAPLITALAISLSGDRENMDTGLATGGSALALPTLLHELGASRRGSKMLKSLKGYKKLPFKTKMSPYVGVPTYAAMALAPWAAKAGKSYFGGYGEPGDLIKKIKDKFK